MRKVLACLTLLGGFVFPGYAQFGRGGGDWMTSGGDAQRSGWTRTDPKISPPNMQKPGFALAWKIKLANEPTTPVTLDRYIGYRGFRALAFMGSSAGNIVAVDTELGRVEWQKPLPGSSSHGAGGSCSGGMTANVTRPTFAAFPTAPTGRGGGGPGRGAAAKSAVGEPGEGAPIIAELAARGAMAGRGPVAGRGPGRGPVNPNDIFSPRVSLVDALSSDGMLHMMYVASGKEPQPAIPFLPANANARGLIVLDKVAYATTSQGCGGVANGVWAVDLESKEVTSWKATGDVAGAEGLAFSGDGTLYVATTGGDLTAIEPKTLKVKSSYHSSGAGFASSPVIFEYAGKTLIAVAAKDGSLHVLDTAALDGPPVAKSQPASDLSPGALASWQDSSGTRWILAASKGAIVSWKLADQGGTPALQAGWVSRDMFAPQPPVVINGVVFAVSAGDRSHPAVLYALDGEAGKEFWNSGKTITSYVQNGGLSASGSQVYLGTNDGTIYAFGFPIEH
ncbi:MAG: PQQ-binding-like beta-propeller repeat protein [Candidatus Sulfopaludibacter sp.]|nr:PQQ-binding-like beta-propeller repeat protein [Candidatus Sulfopaludibacter sp.]